MLLLISTPRKRNNDHERYQPKVPVCQPMNGAFLCTNMLTTIHPKLPMRNKDVTRNYYINQLGFHQLGSTDFDDYLMIGKDQVEIHFFLFKEIDPKENDGQVYIRTDDIDALYHSFIEQGISIHPNGQLQVKPWGQKEFSLLDPDNNLLTFGQGV